MHNRFPASMKACLIAAMALLCTALPALAEDYELDPAHSSFYFKVGHLNASYVYGRFNAPEGKFTLSDNPSFEFTVPIASIDTANQKRDDHLKSPDFFNAREFPVMTFKSTEVAPTDAGYDVTGELSIHGVTKTVTIPLTKVGQAQMPPGTHRTGFATEHTIKRSDFGMDNMLNLVGDEVTLLISFEGIRK